MWKGTYITSFIEGDLANLAVALQGYDTIYLASVLGHDTLGLDASSTAVEAANECVVHRLGPSY